MSDPYLLTRADQLCASISLAIEYDPALAHQVETDALKLGMQDPVLGSRAYQEVLPSVVQLVAVDVVHHFALGIQSAPKVSLGDKDVLRYVLVGASVFWRQDNPVAPPVDELATSPRGVVGALAARELGVGNMAPASTVVVKRLLPYAQRDGDRTPTLAGRVPRFDFGLDDGQSVRRHGDILS